MSDIHRDFLNREAPDLPDIKEEAWRMGQALPEGTIRPEQLAVLRRYLDQLPDGCNICHMDFHPANIMLNDAGYQVIDWSEAVKGAPEADVAMTSLMLSMAETAPGTSLLLKVIIPVFRKAFEKSYRRHLTAQMNMTEEDLRKWALVTGIFRMAMWQLEGERPFLTAMIQDHLNLFENHD